MKAALCCFISKPGEPFSQEEMDEMLTAHADPEKNRIFCKDFIDKLNLEPDK